jgi:predicted nucleotidyltransferase
MTRAELLDRVKQTVHTIEPAADIILYGSRARGNAQAKSDWDFLILLDGVVDDARTNAIRHRLYDLEWDCGEVLCSIVRSHCPHRQSCSVTETTSPVVRLRKAEHSSD